MLPTAITARLTLAGLLLLGGTLSALADPPGRVGRLSYVEGTVSFHAGDQDQWSAAVLNYPVTSGTAFWTEPESRAEIQIGGAEVRLDQSTELDIVRLDDEETQLHVGQGVVNVHLRTAPPRGFHVMTPHSEADLLVAGSYRIDAGVARGDALPEHVQIVVLEGEARINEPRASLDIQPGESAVIGGDPVSFTLIEASTTPFDDWSLMRERREIVSESAQYVSPEVTGYEDLDRNGDWRTSPSHGAVWYPTAVPEGWAPYRYGHWAFVQPWGWTWVDDAPWGFAPFHYGRWVNDGGGWGWHPGERIAQPVYAPALVAFIGGAGFGVSLSVGSEPAVGWVPLAPSEVFRPYYPTSVNYVKNVNINNVTRTEINNITTVNTTTVNNTTVNNFANQQAATVVPSAAFTRAAPVQQATLALPKEQLAQVPVTARVDHLQPSLAARAGIAAPATTQASATAREPVHGPNTPATVAKGPVVAQASPGAAAPVTADPPAPKAPGPVIGAKGHASGVAQPAPTATTPPAGTTAAPTTGRPTGLSAAKPEAAQPAGPAATTPPSGQHNTGAAPGPSVVAPAGHPASTSPNSLPAQSQATSIPPAAPGPPIAHTGAPSPATPPAAAPSASATVNNATPATPAKPASSAAPGPTIAHTGAPSSATPPAVVPSASATVNNATPAAPAKPASSAAPGPTIAHTGAPSSATPPAVVPSAPATVNNATPAAPAKPAPSAAPGPPIAHATAAPPAAITPVTPAPAAAGATPQAAAKPPAPAAPVAEKPSVASPPPQIAHVQPAAPVHAATPPPSAPSPAIAHPSPPAGAANTPPAPARPSPAPPQQVAAHAPAIPHPVQQTQIAPTPTGWVRTPAPPHAPTPPTAAAPAQPAHVAPAATPPPPVPHAADPAKKPDPTKPPGTS